MKTLIAVPCMDMVHADFMSSMVALQKTLDCSFTIVKNTLIHVARNVIARNAIDAGFDRVMWFDSDMVFPPDTLKRISDSMDSGYDLVSGLYFTRKTPIKPVMYEKLWWEEKETGIEAGAVELWEYPENELVRVSGVGFGCCMTSTDILARVIEKYGSAFAPLPGMGEDLSFCWRVGMIGGKMGVDTGIKCGHVGYMQFDETHYKGQSLRPIAHENMIY